jgi:hypothetical protein
MADKDFEVFIQQQIAAHQTLRWLMERIFRETDASEARVLLRQLAVRWQEEDHDSPAEEAFRFYRGMRSALDEDAVWLENQRQEDSEGGLSERLARIPQIPTPLRIGNQTGAQMPTGCNGVRPGLVGDGRLFARRYGHGKGGLDVVVCGSSIPATVSRSFRSLRWGGI